MDVQHSINLQIFERFAADKIEFAYPTRTLYTIRQDASGAPAA
jgi:small-conductance mechanosensitive channel